MSIKPCCISSFSRWDLLRSLVFFAWFAILVACSNSISVNSDSSGLKDVCLAASDTVNESDVNGYNNYENEDVSENGEKSSSSLFEYPYAGIPRISIKTMNYQKIEDRETEISAMLEIWTDSSLESIALPTTIRGRGNTSWTSMPKKSYKLELKYDAPVIGMPKEKDWALIANYADKSLMKNYLMYQLAWTLGMPYSPRCKFVELYLNGDYQGVYLLTETIKVGKNRVDIPKTNESYLMEFDVKVREGDQRIIPSQNRLYNMHFPKNASDSIKGVFAKYINSFEAYLKGGNLENIKDWINVETYITHYWIQEFSKNPDANFGSSVYFSWETNGVIQMGPVWDFDLAFGGHPEDSLADYRNWRIRGYDWNLKLFKDSTFARSVQKYWIDNRSVFLNVLDSIDLLKEKIQQATENNFSRWNVLSSTKSHWHNTAYSSYDEAVENLKKWICKRINWIDAQYGETSKMEAE